MTPLALGLATLGWLATLFGVAWFAERRARPLGAAAGALALGVYATTWTWYGAVGFAAEHGLAFLAIALGPALAWALSPYLLGPLLTLARREQLASVADLWVHRYRSPALGRGLTLFLLLGLLPYLALQIEAVTRSAEAMLGEPLGASVSLPFVLLALGFALTFGARHVAAEARAEGLVAAMALESGVKLVGAAVAAGAALWGVFGGWGGLDRWLQAHPEARATWDAGADDPSFGALLVLAGVASLLLPRQFHVARVALRDDAALRTAAWLFPAWLAAVHLAVPLLTWAATATGATEPAYVALRITSGWPRLLVFFGGVAAALSMLVVDGVALAGMVHRHLLPAWQLPEGPDPYRRLRWQRRATIAAVMGAGWIVHHALVGREGLAQLGILSFLAVAQLAPATFLGVAWPGARAWGAAAGLAVGAAGWLSLGVVPVVLRGWAPQYAFDPGWGVATVVSLGANLVAFVTVSRRVSADAPEAGTGDGAPLPRRASELVTALTPALGGAAAVEVERARITLGLDDGPLPPIDAERLRAQVAQNLAGLFGPGLAALLVAQHLSGPSRSEVARALASLEAERAEQTGRLRGLAAHIDTLRRFQEALLAALPLPAAAVDAQGGVVLWNAALARLTGVPAESAVGLPLVEVAGEWGPALADLAAAPAPARATGPNPPPVRVAGRTRHLAVHKSPLPAEGAGGGWVLLVEDRTEQVALGAQLAHAERLASIGRLGAGVAHEIGNPLTGLGLVARNLLADTTDPDHRERLELVLGQAARIDAIVKSLLRFGHAGEEPAGPVDVAAAAREAAQVVRLSRARRAVEVEVTGEGRVRATENELVQVFVNLLTNAADASRPGDRVEVAVGEVDGRVEITVRDAGAGIPPEVLDRVMEPFFTTKPPPGDTDAEEPGGTGLGLAVVWGIVERLGGRVTLHSTPGVGTIVRASLPAA